MAVGTTRLSEALRALAAMDADDHVLVAAVHASISMLNEGVVQRTRQQHDPDTIRKHRARLRAALLAMAAALEGEESI